MNTTQGGRICRKCFKKKLILLVLAFLILLTLLAFLITSQTQDIYKLKNNTIKNNQDGNTTLRILNGEFNAQFTSIKWTRGSIDGHYVEERNREIHLIHVEFENSSVLMPRLSHPKAKDFQDFIVSNDLQRILLVINQESEWRHSVSADYYIYNVVDGSITELGVSNTSKKRVSLTLWSPISHKLAWIQDYNIHLSMESGQEIQITRDGSNEIRNGISDWVYAEEVLESHEAMWFSLNGNKLAFLRFNDSLVQNYELPFYKKDAKNPYPIHQVLKYPKAGTPNPSVSLHIVDTIDPYTIHDITLNGFKEQIISQVTWISNKSLLVRLFNRVQDHQKLYLVYLKGSQWNVNLIRDEPSLDGKWFPKLAPLHVLLYQNTISYVELQENVDGHTHLAFYKDVENSSPEFLTSGKWQVTTFSGFDSESLDLYFLSTELGSTQRHLYSINLKTREKRLRTPPFSSLKVISWESFIDSETNGMNGYYQVSFSPQCHYYLLTFQGPSIPWQKVVSAHSDFYKFIMDNLNLRLNLMSFVIPKIHYISIPNEANQEMNAKLVLPYNFDSSGKIKYPVLFHPYGGPNSQSVNQVYSMGFDEALASLGMIIVIVDGRGTGYRGREYSSCISLQLGILEATDQISAAKWISQQPYVDTQSIGIWGWSFGGYLAAKVLELGSIFSLAVSVAPVTDWAYYDSVYTERYLKTPIMNPLGYQNSSINSVQGFRNVPFLLIHGTGDDNVHFQHSASLVYQLVGSKVNDFQVQYYTDSDHGILNNNSRDHLYHLVMRFISNAFVKP